MKRLWFFYLTFIISFVAVFDFGSGFLGTNKISRSIAEVHNQDVRHVVFDLDWTLFSEFDPNVIKVDSSRVFEVEGKHYYLTPYAEELLRFLHVSKVKVSFFSGGEESRNLSLLAKAKLSSGESFLSIAYKVLSKKDLTIISTDESLSFSDRYKKDLTKISTDLNSIILIEDNKNFALDHIQKKNVFWLGPTYQVLQKYEDFAILTPKYLPPTKEAFNLSLHKLLILKEAIREARFLEKSEGKTFVEAMNLIENRLAFSKEQYTAYSRNLQNKGFKFLPSSLVIKNVDKTCDALIQGIFQN